eukprot:TRINITY_DN24280_c0_g1_i1.p1 TRINITY_DN24280_c0_g1~~TRINITY_DN24280_c0_g1_i1.p1  ORF type:complete len:419 (+),score=93.29 TRINITY_DN24280_c0_g1_i1:94-1257(+)
MLAVCLPLCSALTVCLYRRSTRNRCRSQDAGSVLCIADEAFHAVFKGETSYVRRLRARLEARGWQGNIDAQSWRTAAETRLSFRGVFDGLCRSADALRTTRHPPVAVVVMSSDADVVRFLHSVAATGAAPVAVTIPVLKGVDAAEAARRRELSETIRYTAEEEEWPLLDLERLFPQDATTQHLWRDDALAEQGYNVVGDLVADRLDKFLFTTEQRHPGGLTPIFVYGTLKRGFSNYNARLRGKSGVHYRCDAVTVDRFPMFVDFYRVPYMVDYRVDERSGFGGQVHGELFHVDADRRDDLDVLEGHKTAPHLRRYTRKQTLLQTESGRVVVADAYFLRESPVQAGGSREDWLRGRKLITDYTLDVHSKFTPPGQRDMSRRKPWGGFE